jgi:hypothetical protein
MSTDEPVRKGSPFPESVKLEARRRAFFRCCYCHDRPGDQVHHLLAQEHGGLGVIENAILLCVQCHADYGHRPEKRLQLQQARDHWYEIVERRYSAPLVEEVLKLDDLATKNDVVALRDTVTGLFQTLMIGLERGSTSASEVANVGSSIVNSIAANPVVGSLSFTGYAPTVIVTARCSRCGNEERANAAFCSMCGARLGSST